MIRSSSLARLGIAAAAAVLISGCATTNNPKDPFEGFNRSMFSFNEAVDKAAVKPAATAYKNVVPDMVQTGVGNFFGNIGDVWTAANNVLQGNVEAGMSDVARVIMNTMFGLLGLIDVASDAGLPKHREDFGQTLGKWGVKPGPYVVLPLLGPSTVRDTAALPLDIAGDPWFYVNPAMVQNVGLGVRIVDQRAAALGASNLLEEAALDKYEFVRDAYLQRRKSLIKRKSSKGSEQARQSVDEGDWETVSDGSNKLSGDDAVNKRFGEFGTPGEASSRGSAARAFYYGLRPR